jgi:protein-disulfide isomerase
MSSENALTGLLQGLAEGEKLQVDSTPTVFILDTKQNKRLRVPGTPSEGDIANIIAGILR